MNPTPTPDSELVITKNLISLQLKTENLYLKLTTIHYSLTTNIKIDRQHSL